MIGQNSAVGQRPCTGVEVQLGEVVKTHLGGFEKLMRQYLLIGSFWLDVESVRMIIHRALAFSL